jgi:hypothetical protein
MALWLPQCLVGPSMVASGVEFSVFESLKIKCTQSLEPNEVKELIENVRDKEVNPQCRIDTTNIKTLRDAKVCPCVRQLELLTCNVCTCKSNEELVCAGREHCPGVRHRSVPRRVLPAIDRHKHKDLQGGQLNTL